MYNSIINKQLLMMKFTNLYLSFNHSKVENMDTMTIKVFYYHTSFSILRLQKLFIEDTFVVKTNYVYN